MPENPLLPNARLRDMFALMQRCRSLAQLTRPAQPRFEAIFAATTLHLQPGDYCAPLTGNKASETLAADRLAEIPSAVQTPLPTHNRLALAAGAALALKLAGGSRLAIAYSHTGPAATRSDAGWPEALTYAAKAALPLIHICTAPEASSRSATALNWASISRLAKPLKLPVVTVDGTDAPAIYRVMQETAHRARLGDGAAVIWCILPPVADRSPSQDPLRKMQRYLADRDLLSSVPAKKRNRP